MAYGRLIAKPLPESMLTCQLAHDDNIRMKFYFKDNIFMKENAFEYVVCKIAVIFRTLVWLNTWSLAKHMVKVGLGDKKNE